MNPSKIQCPACKQNKVDVKKAGIADDWWLVVCTNGECSELPEVIAKHRGFAIKMFSALSKIEGEV